MMKLESSHNDAVTSKQYLSRDHLSPQLMLCCLIQEMRAWPGNKEDSAQKINLVLHVGRRICKETWQWKLDTGYQSRANKKYIKESVRARITLILMSRTILPKATKMAASLPGDVEWFFASLKNLIKLGSNIKASIVVSRNVYSFNGQISQKNRKIREEQVIAHCIQGKEEG